MRLLTLPVTIVRVPLEFGFGVVKRAAGFAYGVVAPSEEERPAEWASREEPAPAGNGRPSEADQDAPRTRTRGTTRSRTKARPRRRADVRSTATKAAPAEGASAAPATAERPSAGAASGEAATAERQPAEAASAAAAAAEAALAEPPPVDAAPAEAAPPEPVHVSEEPELVAEVAEAGAEEGAGAEVQVDEPWPGYDDMNAADIEDRLVAEGTEAAAAVRLYEASRKGRASVLEAASRNLRD
jgi:hypothetical protein